MKSILVIGIRRFDQYLCENPAKHDSQIMAMGISEEKLEPILPYVASAKIRDYISEAVLESLGIGNLNICLICTENNFQNSLEVTSLIKEIGVEYVVNKTDCNTHARLLLKNETNEVVCSNQDVAGKVVVRYSINNVFGYTELVDGTSIYGIRPLPQQMGKSIKDSGIRQLYGISVIAVKNPDGRMRFMSGADHIIAGDNHLMVIGKQEDAEKIVKHLTKDI